MKNKDINSASGRFIKYFILILIGFPLVSILVSLLGVPELIRVIHFIGAMILPLNLLLLIILFLYTKKLRGILERLQSGTTEDVEKDQLFVNRYSFNSARILFIGLAAGVILNVGVTNILGIFISVQIMIFMGILLLLLALVVSYILYYLTKQDLYPSNEFIQYQPLSLFSKFFIPVISPVLVILVLTGVMIFKLTYTNNHSLAKYLLTNTVSKSNMLLDNVYRRAEIELGAYVRNDLIQSMDLEKIRDFLVEIGKTKDEGVAVYFVANKTGRGAFSNGKMINVDDRNYFKEVMKTGKNAYSEPLISKSTGKPVIVVAVPVKRGNTLVGMIGISLIINSIEEKAIDRKILKSARYLILSKDGRIILDFANKYTKKIIGKDIKDDGKNFSGTSQLLKGDLDNRFLTMVFDGVTKYVYCQMVETAQSYLVLLEDQDEFLAGVNRQIIIIVIGIMITLAMLVGIVFGATRVLSGPILRIIEVFKSMSQGELADQVDDYVPDEFGELIRHLKIVQEKLRQIIHVALDSSRQLADSAEAFTATSQDLSQNAQSQAASVEEASASLEEVSSSIEMIAANSKDQSDFARKTYESMDELKRLVKEVADYAAEALNVANNTNIEAQRGNELMKSTIQGMDSIDSSTKQIAEIVKMISDISEQVNLLSLNAAIEAARAGEHGRGFAVVADEISKLAEQTAQSTHSINDLVKTGLSEVMRGKEHVDNTSKALFAIIDNIKKTDEMVRKITESARIQAEFSDKVVNDTRKVMEMAESISLSTDEQKNTNREMTSTIDQINQLTQNVAASAEEIASSSEEIGAQTEALNRHIEFFKIG